MSLENYNTMNSPACTDNNGFEVANALTSVRNGDRSVTYFCERREIYLTGSLRGELRVKDIGDGKVKVVYSDGICKGLHGLHIGRGTGTMVCM